jgi:hypothetical protein
VGKSQTKSDMATLFFPVLKRGKGVCLFLNFEIYVKIICPFPKSLQKMDL